LGTARSSSGTVGSVTARRGALLAGCLAGASGAACAGLALPGPPRPPTARERHLEALEEAERATVRIEPGYQWATVKLGNRCEPVSGVEQFTSEEEARDRALELGVQVAQKLHEEASLSYRTGASYSVSFRFWRCPPSPELTAAVEARAARAESPPAPGPLAWQGTDHSGLELLRDGEVVTSFSHGFSGIVAEVGDCPAARPHAERAEQLGHTIVRNEVLLASTLLVSAAGMGLMIAGTNWPSLDEDPIRDPILLGAGAGAFLVPIVLIPAWSRSTYRHGEAATAALDAVDVYNEQCTPKGGLP